VVLVTGGTGLIGSHLLLQLVKEGTKVRALRHSPASSEKVKNLFDLYDRQNAKSLFQKIEWVDGDILDVVSLEKMMEGMRFVYHCAALVSFHPAEAHRLFKVNVEGTANIVNACLHHNIEKLCYVSSVAAFSRTNENTPVDETCFWKASPENSDYSISKYTAENEVWRGVEEGLNAVIVNPSVVLGPADWSAGSAGLFAKAAQGLKFCTEGVTGFVDVRDVVNVMMRLMESPISAQRFLLNSENISYYEFYSLANACFGNKAPAYKAGKWISEIAWRAEKIRSTLTGAKPLITKATAKAANRKVNYSNGKIKKSITIDFIPVAQSIHDTGEMLKKMYKLSS
jgi:dihydroflavonol-4-reductase